MSLCVCNVTNELIYSLWVSLSKKLFLQQLPVSVKFLHRSLYSWTEEGFFVAYVKYCSDEDIYKFNTQNLLSLTMLYLSSICSWMAYKEAKEKKKALKKSSWHTEISIRAVLDRVHVLKKSLTRKMLPPCYSFQVYFKHCRDFHGTRVLTFSINTIFFHTLSSPWLSLLDPWNTFCIRQGVLTRL